MDPIRDLEGFKSLVAEYRAIHEAYLKDSDIAVPEREEQTTEIAVKQAGRNYYMKKIWKIGVAAVACAALLVAVYKFGSRWFEELRRYIHVSAFNCAVMGTLFTINKRASMDGTVFNLGGYVTAGFEAGIGFIIAALILTAAYRKLNSSKVPASFRGFPAMLVYLGIISMAVYSLK